jgi:hypothetical protein
MVYHLWNSGERVRNYEQKYETEVQRENSEQFNYYTECVSEENKRNKTKSLKVLLQEVHVLLPAWFKISSERSPSFIYMTKKRQKQRCFCHF